MKTRKVYGRLNLDEWSGETSCGECVGEQIEHGAGTGKQTVREKGTEFVVHIQRHKR